MTGIREAFDDVADEITPGIPPVEAAMRQGKKKRNGRLAAIVGGTAGAAVIGAGLAVGIPALAGQHGEPAIGSTLQVNNSSSTATAAALPTPKVLMRPVLLESTYGAKAVHGDSSLVNDVTGMLFDELRCTPQTNSKTPTQVVDTWKSSVGYTEVKDQWDAGGQVVSCDANGDKYVLGKPVLTSADVSKVSIGLQPNGSKQWIVIVRLNTAGTKAFGALSKNQFTKYSSHAATNPNDAVLDSTAVVVNGDVQEAPETNGALTSGTFEITGPQPTGFTKAEATSLAADLKSSPPHN